MKRRNAMATHDAMPWSNSRRHNDLPQFFKNIGEKLKRAASTRKSIWMMKYASSDVEKYFEAGKYRSALKKIKECRDLANEVEQKINQYLAEEE